MTDDPEREALLADWRRTRKVAPPKGMSRQLMAQIVAYEQQARQHGRLSPAVRRRLAQRGEGKAVATSPQLHPGARLVREWNGVNHVVDVTANGVIWQGRTWRSLSAVARAITGARWSGPRFFGLLAKGEAE